MASSKKVTSAQLRAIAADLHRKAATRGKTPRNVVITADMTATGQGIIRFRESRILQAYRGSAGSRSQKLRYSKVRAAG